MSQFKDRVIDVIRRVPSGKVVSYGQVAALVGVARAARQVGWILNQSEPAVVEGRMELPWWRVINNEGYLSIRGTMVHSKLLQKQLLEDEGVVVSNELIVDMSVYRWRPSVKLLKSLQLDDVYIEMLIEKYGV